jgi:hypothetical protein
MNTEEQTYQLAMDIINHLKNKTRDTWTITLYNGEVLKKVKGISANFCRGTEGITSSLTYFDELTNETVTLDLFHAKTIE